MGTSLITHVNNPFPVEELRHAYAQKNPPPNNSPLEGEYIPAESVDSERKQPADITFRLFIEIADPKSPLIERKMTESMSAYGLSAYQELDKFTQRKEKMTGNYIDIII